MLPGTTTPAPIVVTTVGLNPESAAAAVAATAEESVQGSEELEVTDPDKFVKDPAAKEALKEAIAQEVGVSVDAVIIKGETVEPQAPAVLLQSHGGKARRRETPSGRVNVSYEIVPQMSGKTVDEVMDKMEHMDPQEVAEVHEKSLLRNNAAKYSVKVEDTKTVVVSMSTGNTVREADPLRSGCSVVALSAPLVVWTFCQHLCLWSS